MKPSAVSDWAKTGALPNASERAVSEKTAFLLMMMLLVYGRSVLE
jgi:hypothetical protein